MDFKPLPTKVDVDFSDKRSIKKWCNNLECSEKDLILAVSIVGNSYMMVDTFLILNDKKKKQR